MLGFRDQWSGIARIYLDGALKGEVDTYATTSVAKVPMYSVSDLPAGTHTIQVLILGTKSASSLGKWVWIDAFDVASGNASSTTTSTGSTTTSTGGTNTTSSTGTTSGTTTTGSTGTASTGSTPPAPTPAPSPTLYRIQENNAAVRYTGTWGLHTGSVYSGNIAKLANKSGARASFTFVGTSITWIGFRDQASGIARVYIDDVLKNEIDTYSQSAATQASVYTLANLSAGTHTIAIEATGRRTQGSKGSWVWVDAFDYFGDALSTSLSEARTPTSTIAIAGGTSVVSADGPSLQVGSGLVDAGALGLAPSGLAIVSHRENGALVSEAGVPGVSAVFSGRIPADIAGPVTTGLAVSNPNNIAANMTFFFTDANGFSTNGNTVQIPAHGQISRFLNQAPFGGPQSMHGTLTFKSDVPVSAVALRGLVNERGEFLITPLPVADVDDWVPASMFFPHFAEGGGWTTRFVLVNPTEETISGKLTFMSPGQNGVNPGSLTLNVDGQTRSSVPYSIPPRSSRTFSTAGNAAQIVVGSAQITPDSSNAVPSGVAIVSLKTNGVTVAEAGIPSSSIGNAFRLYAEANGAASIRTGIAVTNLGPSESQVTVELTRLDGSSTGLRGSVTVPASGQRALFLNDIAGLQSLPGAFKGILRISSDSDIGVAGLRTRINERGDFLMSTIYPTDENMSWGTKVAFPQVVDGSGYSTEMILYSGSPAQPGSGNLQLYSQSGGSLGVSLK